MQNYTKVITKKFSIKKSSQTNKTTHTSIVFILKKFIYFQWNSFYAENTLYVKAEELFTTKIVSHKTYINSHFTNHISMIMNFWYNPKYKSTIISRLIFCNKYPISFDKQKHMKLYNYVKLWNYKIMSFMNNWWFSTKSKLNKHQIIRYLNKSYLFQQFRHSRVFGRKSSTFSKI